MLHTYVRLVSSIRVHSVLVGCFSLFHNEIKLIIFNIDALSDEYCTGVMSCIVSSFPIFQKLKFLEVLYATVAVANTVCVYVCVPVPHINNQVQV